MNSRSGSAGAPEDTTKELNVSHIGRCVFSYSARKAAQSEGSACAYPENVGAIPGPFISSGLQDTIRTNGASAVTVAGKHTTLSSTITSGLTFSIISRSRGSQYTAPSMSAWKVGWMKVVSCSMVGLRNSGAVSRMKSFQNAPGSSSPEPESSGGAARSTNSSSKPSGANRPFHEDSAAKTTRCPRSSSTLPMPMHWLVGP